ncbi:MAG: Type 1 glutamine amidotransferase-like domain-containing protein [Bacteroidales bacterium]|nr:Type 1 glutamine amidotransferase-like domain-containing protein [Bacteroidales bacterium]
MTLILTGSPTRFGEDRFTEDNGLLAAVRAALPASPRVLLVSAAPDDVKFTDYVLDSMSDCIRNSGITPSSVTMLDRRNEGLARDLVRSADWIVLCGGHVPTQNRFLHEIKLKELLRGFDGLVMGCSAGSMNCAERVYSHPELPGEAIDPAYPRWLDGLGLTKFQIVPHYYQVRDVVLDGKRLFEDVIFPESWRHAFYTFPDGGYILSKDGRETLYGTAWEISNGQMRQIAAENETYNFMNVIFISPHFPQTYSHFCSGLRANGVNVLGIADAQYYELNNELRGALNDYYKVNNLEDYGEVYRAVAWFAHKYGKIDWIESNNEYWLEQDARLRTDFNVTTGIKSDRVAAIRNKSEMKKYYAAGGIPTARQIKCSEGPAKVKAFVKKTGYPVIAKPDGGMGASGTTKIHDAAGLDAWFAAHPDNYGLYVLEEFITGLLVSYDAIYNSKGEPVFENNTVFPTPIMEIVHDNLETCYWTNKTVPAKLAAIGRRTVKAFDIKSRFVHLEFFQLDRDREGLGKKGDYVGLEVNMRPPGGYTPDMMNYAHDTDVFQIWADMVVFDEARKPQGDQYYCAYAARRDCYTYKHSHQEIMERFGIAVCMAERVPAALSDDLCDMAYIARFADKKEIDRFFTFVCER